jgi:hypothetical protein
VSKIFRDDGRELLRILDNLVKGFEINNEFPSLKRPIKQFDFDDVYTDILNYYEHIIDHRNEYDDYISKNVFDGNEIIDRYKAEDSLRYKWNKNLEAGRRLF